MDLQYPIGKFAWPASVNAAERETHLQKIEALPAELRAAVAGLSDAQLDTPYRDGGWRLRQVVHHLADSHMHVYMRSKFAITEDRPVIKAYDENVWASFADASEGPVEWSLQLVENLHARWTRWWRSLGPADFERVFLHPENGPMRLDVTLALYAWHGAHHLEHIRGLRSRMGW